MFKNSGNDVSVLRTSILFCMISLYCFSSQNNNINIQVDVKLKLFDVLVFDENGAPIKNLTKNQFKIFIDNKEVQIGSFDIIDFANSPYQHNNETLKSKNDFNISSINNRLFVIIFHNLPWALDARKEISEGIFEFLEKNHNKNDYYAIYYFTGPTVKLLCPFVNDIRIVNKVINDFYIENFAGFLPFLPSAGDDLKSGQKEFGSEAMLDSIVDTEFDTKLYDSMPPDNLDAKTIFEMNSTLKNLDLLLRSFSTFKGRKEIFLFSESISLKRYNPIRGIKGRGTTGIEYDRLIQNARTNNIVINSFNINLMNEFYERAQFKIRGVYSNTSTKNSITRQKGKKFNDLKIIASDTLGIYIDRARKKNIITENLENIYKNSFYVYYLGVYINDLKLESNKEHSVRIETVEDAEKLVYQPSFRSTSDYKKMDDGDRFSHFLDAMYGTKKYDSLNINDSLLHFPYGQNNNLLVSIYHLPLTDNIGDSINLSVIYYNPVKMDSKQFNDTWDIGKIKAIEESSQVRFIVGIPLEAGEYVYRYAARDEETGDLKNEKYSIHIDSSKDFLSSPVAFGTTDISSCLTNLFGNYKDSVNGSEIASDFLLNKSFNPFNYDNRIFTPLVDEPVNRNQDIYIMFMYNSLQLNKNSYQLEYILSDKEAERKVFKMKLAEPEKEFSGGWKRVTLKVPISEISFEEESLKFTIFIKDKIGNEIESEYLDIRLK